MYKLEYKIETTIFIKFSTTGAVNVHINVFIFALTHFWIFFPICSYCVKIALGGENAIEHNIKLVHWIAHLPGKFRLCTDTSIQTINKIVITDFFAQ